MRVGIIGGGIAGLSAAYELSKKGQNVTVFEQSSVLGGLASSFLLDGGFIERYYHFICRGDATLFSLLEELGLDHRLRWVKTRMGLFYEGALYPFGRPLDLWRFPHLTFREKLKFGLALMEIKSGKVDAWKEIENIPAPEWLVSRFGGKIYEIVHEPLIRLKFGAYASTLSAAWMWARIHRVGKSRTRLAQNEILGYIEGGTKALVDRLEQQIIRQGGTIHRSAAVSRIEWSSDSARRGIRVGSGLAEFEAVLSTVPSPVFLTLVPEVQGPYWESVRKIDSIGVICVLLKIEKPLTKNFWLNISDRRIPLAGVIEYTNLNPRPLSNEGKIIYLPQYLPSSDERFGWDDEKIISQYSGYLSMIRRGFEQKEISARYVFRDSYAQPICEVGFSTLMPAIKTPHKGLYMTDSSQLHPDDRTVSNSIELGRKAARLILADFASPS